MKIFISHKYEDAVTANSIARELANLRIDYYLDLLDGSVIADGKKLTDHIRGNLNQCTDLIVVMSSITRYSQWVPFEVGMAAQTDKPMATFLKEDVILPEYLQYWPRLKQYSDIRKYVAAKNEVDREYRIYHYDSSNLRQKTERFYNVLKQRL